jgi:hypothetical protein
VLSDEREKKGLKGAMVGAGTGEAEVGTDRRRKLTRPRRKGERKVKGRAEGVIAEAARRGREALRPVRGAFVSRRVSLWLMQESIKGVRIGNGTKRGEEVSELEKGEDERGRAER